MEFGCLVWARSKKLLKAFNPSHWYAFQVSSFLIEMLNHYIRTILSVLLVVVKRTLVPSGIIPWQYVIKLVHLQCLCDPLKTTQCSKLKKKFCLISIRFSWSAHFQICKQVILFAPVIFSTYICLCLRYMKNYTLHIFFK